MLNMLQKICLFTLILVLLCSLPCFANEGYPTKNIKIIVPFGPGGAVDTTCRIIAKYAAEYLDGKKMIVENKAGGGAVIGQTYVSNAEPDGYTLLAYTSSVVNNPLTKKTTYTHKSFQPVVMYCFDPEVLLIPSDSKFKTLEGFIEYAKENEVSFCTPGFSTSHHIAGLVLQNITGAKFNYIHNESGAIQTQQLLGGHVDSGMMSFGEALGQIKAGSVRALGTMDSERRSDFPDVPTFQESGIDILFGPWRGLAVPKDTPIETVDYLADLFKKVIENEEFRKDMQKAGYPIVYRGPEAFTKYVDRQAENMKEILHLLEK